MSIGNYSDIKEPNAFTKNYDLNASKRTLLLLTLYAPISQNGQTHTICWQSPTNCLSVFDHFVELALKLALSKCSHWHGRIFLLIFI